MKKSIALAFIFQFSVFSFFAQSLTGYEIMKKADEVPEPVTSSSTATLTIHTKKGSDRKREVIMKSKDYGDVKKEVIVFVTPKDVAGTGYLMFEYEEDANGNKKDSDNWLYMPAMKKTRRIASSGSESDGSFMGTDFTYRDMGDRKLSDYDYKLLGEEKIVTRLNVLQRTKPKKIRAIFLTLESLILSSESASFLTARITFTEF